MLLFLIWNWWWEQEGGSLLQRVQIFSFSFVDSLHHGKTSILICPDESSFGCTRPNGVSWCHNSFHHTWCALSLFHFAVPWEVTAHNYLVNRLWEESSLSVDAVSLCRCSCTKLADNPAVWEVGAAVCTARWSKWFQTVTCCVIFPLSKKPSFILAHLRRIDSAGQTILC